MYLIAKECFGNLSETTEVKGALSAACMSFGIWWDKDPYIILEEK